MAYRIRGLDGEQFAHLYGLSDEALEAQGARRYVVDAKPGFPDRVELRDLDVGETAILLNFEHQPADTPYRASHAIFVRENARKPCDVLDDVPEVMRARLISLRAFSDGGDMLYADLADGRELAPLMTNFFADPEVAYLHAHYAKRGCYAAKITRD